MFERLTAPKEIFNFKLGATLKMEQTILEILDAASTAPSRLSPSSAL